MISCRFLSNNNRTTSKYQINFYEIYTEYDMCKKSIEIVFIISIVLIFIKQSTHYPSKDYLLAAGHVVPHFGSVTGTPQKMAKVPKWRPLQTVLVLRKEKITGTEFRLIRYLKKNRNVFGGQKLCHGEGNERWNVLIIEHHPFVCNVWPLFWALQIL